MIFILRSSMQEIERVMSACVLTNNLNLTLSEALGMSLETIEGDDEDA